MFTGQSNRGQFRPRPSNNNYRGGSNNSYNNNYSGGGNRNYNNRFKFLHQFDEISKKYPRNNYIKADQVRLLGPNKENLGIMSFNEAYKMAQDQDLDLVQVVPNADPVVCRIISWQKFCYEIKQKEKIQNKKQKGHELKEIKIKSTIGEGDLNRKLDLSKKFLDKGKQVKLKIEHSREKHGKRLSSKELFIQFKNSVLTKVEEYSIIVTKQEQEKYLSIILKTKDKNVKE